MDNMKTKVYYIIPALSEEKRIEALILISIYSTKNIIMKLLWQMGWSQYGSNSLVGRKERSNSCKR